MAQELKLSEKMQPFQKYFESAPEGGDVPMAGANQRFLQRIMRIMLMGIFLSPLANQVMAQGPNLINGDYDTSSDMLNLYFDQTLDPSLGTGVNVQLSDDSFGINVLSLTAPFYSYFISGSTLSIQLDGVTEAPVLEAWPNISSMLQVNVDADIVQASTTGNPAASYVAISVTGGATNPVLQNADYDPNTDELILMFDQAVDAATVDVNSSIGLSTDGGGADFVNLTTPLTVNTGTDPNDGEVIVVLNSSDAIAVEAMPGIQSDFRIELSANFIQNSANTNYSQAVYYSDYLYINYLNGAAAPYVTSASYDGSMDELRLFFNENLNDASFNTNINIALSTDNGSADFVDLTLPLSFYTGSVADDNEIIISLGTADANAVEALPGVESSLEMQIGSGLINSLSNSQPSDMLDYSYDLFVSYSSGSPTPNLMYAEYDEQAMSLLLQFDQSLDNVLGVGSQIALSADGFVNNLYIYNPFSGYSFSGSDITIQLSGAENDQLVNLPNYPTGLQLNLDDDVVRAFGIGNGYYGNFSVNVINSGNPPPIANGAAFDVNTNELKIFFDRPVIDASFNPNVVVGVSTDQGIADFEYLTLPMTMNTGEFADDAEIILVVSAAQASAISSLPGVENSLNLYIEANLINTADGYVEPVGWLDGLYVTYTGAGGGNPNLNWAEYDSANRELRLAFDTNLDNTLGSGNQVHLSTDGFSSEVSLINPFFNYRFETDHLVIGLSESEHTSLISLPNISSNLQVTIDADLVLAGSMGNLSGQMVGVNIIDNGGGFGFDYASYGSDNNELHLSFFGSLNDNSFDVNATVRFSVDGGSSYVLELPTPLNIHTGMDPNDYEMVIVLSETEASVLESWPDLDFNLTLELSGNLVQSINNDPSTAISFGENRNVEYYNGGGSSFDLSWAEYDEGIKAVRLGFTNPVDPNTFGAGQNLEISGDGFVTKITLSQPFNQVQFMEWEVVIYVDPNTQHDAIVSLAGYPNSLQMNMDADLFQSNGTGNLPLSNYGMSTTYSDPMPYFHWVEFDESANELRLGFDKLLESNLGSGTQIALSTDDFATSYNIAVAANSYSFSNEVLTINLNPSEVQNNLISMPNYPYDIRANIDGDLVRANGIGNDPIMDTYVDVRNSQYFRPRLDWANLIESGNTLTLGFDMPLDANIGSSVAVELSFDWFSTQMTLQAPFSNYSVSENELQISLTATEITELQSLSGYPNDLNVKIGSGLVYSATKPNDAVTEPRYVDILRYGTAPMIVHAELDDGGMEVRFEFDVMIDEIIPSGKSILFSTDDFLTSYTLSSPFGSQYFYPNVFGLHLDNLAMDNIRNLPGFPNNLKIQMDDGLIQSGAASNSGITSQPIQITNYMGAPYPDGAEYRSYSKELVIWFGKDLLSIVDGKTLSLSTDNFATQVSFSSPFTNYNLNGGEFRVFLDETTHNSLLALPNFPADLKLNLDAGMFSSNDGASLQASNIMVHYQEDNYDGGNPTGGDNHLDRVFYNPLDNKLELVFYDPLVDSLANLQGSISLSTDNGGMNTVSFPVPLQLETGLEINDNQVFISLGAAGDNLESFPGLYENLKISMDGGIFQSSYNTPNMPISFADYYRVEVGNDGKPRLQRVELDEGNSEIRMHFSEAIDHTVAGINFNISNDNFATSKNLAEPFSEIRYEGHSIQFRLTTAQLADISTMAGYPGDLRIQFAPDNFFTIDNIGNTNTLDYPVEFYVPAVELFGAHYNPVNGTLRFEFDRPLNDVLTNVNGLIKVRSANFEGAGTEPVTEIILSTPISEISAASNDNEIILDVSSQMADINALPNFEMDLQFSIEESVFKSEDGSLGNRFMDFGKYHVSVGTVRPALIGYWKMDAQDPNTVFDHSGFDNYGTIVGTANYLNGMPGLNLAGNNTYVQMANHTNHVMENEISISAWVNMSSGNKIQTILSKGTDIGTHFYFGITGDNRAVFKFYNGQWYEFISSATIPLSEWHMIGVSYHMDRGAHFTLDEQHIMATASQPSNSNLIPNPGATITMGADKNGLTPFDGSLALVRLYNYAKDDMDFYHVYNSELGYFDPNMGFNMQHAVYDDFNGILKFHFNDAVDMSKLCTNCQFSIGTSPDNVIPVQVPLKLFQAGGEEYQIFLDLRAYKDQINALPQLSTELSFGVSNGFATAKLDSNLKTPEILIGDKSVTLFSQIQNVWVQNAEANLTTGELKLVFNMPVEDASLDVNKVLALTSDFGNQNSILIAAPHITKTTVANDNIVVFDISKEVETIKSWPNMAANLFMAMEPEKLFSFPGSNIRAEGYNWSLPVHVIQDTQAPVVSVTPLSTADATPKITGQVDDPTATIQVKIGTQQLTAVNNGNGSWEIPDNTIQALADGIYDVIATATDMAGNVGTDTTSNELKVDKSAPVIAVTNLKTATQSPAISGTINDSTAIISVIINQKSYVAVNDKKGKWTIAAGVIAKLPQGVYDVLAKATDVLGNEGTDNSINELIIDINDAPIFAALGNLPEIKEDQPFNFDLVAQDPDSTDVLTYAILSGQKDWMSLSGKNFSGTPTNNDVGTHLVQFTVSDSKLLDTLILELLVLNVNDAPVIESVALLDPSNQQWKEDFTNQFSISVNDIDNADIINVVPASLPKFIKLNNSTVSGIQTKFDFSVTPLQADTGNHNFKIIFIDKSGDSASLSVKANVEETNDMPHAKLTSTKIKGGAVQLQLDVIDEDGYVQDTKFEHKLLNSAGEIKDSGVISLPLLEYYPLLDGEYIVQLKAIDKYGLKQDTALVSSFQIAGVKTANLTAETWHMVSLPKASGSKSVLGTDTRAYHWVDNGITNNLYSNYITGEGLTTLDAGKGYWIFPKTDVSINVTENELIKSDVKINLVNGGLGWNQVGNPFPYPIDVAQSGLTFWKWNPDSAEISDANGVLMPWTAYWVQVNENQELLLPARPYFGDKAQAKLALKTFSNINDWNGRLILSSGKLLDGNNIFGASPNGYQKSGNISEPPKMGSFVSLFFTGKSDNNNLKASKFTTDIRNDINEDEEWFEFGVYKVNSDNKEAQINFEGIDRLEENGYFVFLVNKQNATQMTSGQSAKISLSSVEKYYQLVVTKNQNFIESFTSQFGIAQNYPNPVRSTTNIKLNIPYQFAENGKKIEGIQNVSIELFNMSGKKVKTIYNEKLSPGEYNFQWRRPISLPNGTYIYRVNANQFRAHKKMVLTR